MADHVGMARTAAARTEARHDLIERLTERADMAEMAVARLIGERDALRAQVERLTKSRDDMEQFARETVDELAFVKTRRARLREAYHRLCQKRRALRAEVERLSDAQIEAVASAARAAGRLDVVQAAYESAVREVEALRADAERLDWLEDEARCSWITVSAASWDIIYSGRSKVLREGIDAARSAA